MDLKQFAALLEENNKKNNEVLRNEIKGDLKEELSTFKEELKTEIKEMVSHSLEETNKEINSLKDQLSLKDKEIDALKERTMSLEFTSRKKNIVLFRVTENEENRDRLINGVCRLIRDVADSSFTESEIDDVYRLGRKGGAPRPIMLILNKGSKRSFLLSQRKKFAEKNIGIAEDLPKEVYEGRKTLYKLADKLREEGKRVQFRRDKLFVEGKEWNPKDIAEEEADQERKRKLSLTPGEGTSNGRRTIPKLNLKGLETPKSQAVLDQFFSPSATRNNGMFEFVADK